MGARGLNRNRSYSQDMSQMRNSNYSMAPTQAGNYPSYYQAHSDPTDMSCIIPPTNGVGGLFLGNINAARDYELLKYNGIKAVLTSAVEAGVHYDHSIVPYHLIVNAQDSSQFNLSEYFDQAVDFIRRCLRSTNVLIHCMAGISRSCTLTIAYLMSDKGMNVQSALNFIRQRRPIVSPNAGFRAQLKQYESILSQRQGNLKGSMRMGQFSRNLQMNNSSLGYQNNVNMNPFKYSGVRQGFY